MQIDAYRIPPIFTSHLHSCVHLVRQSMLRLFDAALTILSESEVKSATEV